MIINNECKAIVPYVSVKNKKTYLKSVFESRKKHYFLMLAVFILSFYIGFAGSENISERFDLLFQNDVGMININMITVTGVLFLSSFTIFSPIISIFYFAVMSFGAGVCYQSINGFAESLKLLLFCFISFLFCVFVFSCYQKSQFGAKQVMKMSFIINLSLRTVLYLITIMLCMK